MNTSNLKDSAIAAFRVWIFVALGLFLPGLLGWIAALTEWARSNGTTPFPDAHGLAFLLVAAVSGGFPAALAFIVRFLENSFSVTILPRAAGPQPVAQPPR